MHRRDTAQFRIDLRDKRAELQLFRELACVEIANRARLNFRRIDLCIIDRFFAGLDDDVPDGFPFLLQVTLKIRAPAAENVDFVHHALINLANLSALSSRAKRGASRGSLSYTSNN